MLVTGTGDVLIVDLTGKFTPNRVPPGVILQCDKMYVSIDSDTGDVINVGCR